MCRIGAESLPNRRRFGAEKEKNWRRIGVESAPIRQRLSAPIRRQSRRRFGGCRNSFVLLCVFLATSNNSLVRACARPLRIRTSFALNPFNSFAPHSHSHLTQFINSFAPQPCLSRASFLGRAPHYTQPHLTPLVHTSLAAQSHLSRTSLHSAAPHSTQPHLSRTSAAPQSHLSRTSVAPHSTQPHRIPLSRTRSHLTRASFSHTVCLVRSAASLQHCRSAVRPSALFQALVTALLTRQLLIATTFTALLRQTLQRCLLDSAAATTSQRCGSAALLFSALARHAPMNITSFKSDQREAVA